MPNLEELEDNARKAKEAYQEKQTDHRKDAHRAAAQELSKARERSRKNRSGDNDSQEG